MRTDMLDLDPHRGQGEHYLLYTEVEGGEFHVIAFSPQQYIQLLDTGAFPYRTGDTVRRVEPAFAMLVVGVDGYDFRIRQLQQQHHGGVYRR